MRMWIIKLSKWIVINFVIFGTLSNAGNSISTKTKVCEGADHPLEMLEKKPFLAYQASVSRYAKCTHIVKHLSLFHLKATDDISFLSSIVEVGGSVFIGASTVREIPLSNLRVIHGRECFRGCAFFFFKNKAPSSESAYLNLRSLVKIKRCNVAMFQNKGFCNLDAITAVNGLFDRKDQKNISKLNDKCPVEETCSPSCDTENGTSICHGPRTDMCRRVPEIVEECPSQCLGCFLEANNTKCLACRSYSDGEECVNHCSASKFVHFTTCADCPKRYLISQGECVANCPTQTYPKDGRCERCTASLCESVCRIKASTTGTLRPILKKLKHCTIVDGDIKIDSVSSSTRSGDKMVRAEDFKNLKNVRHINGYLYMDLRNYPTIKNLSFLSNLESVNAPKHGGILILFSRALEYLGLTKLRAVNASLFMFLNNSKLCYLEDMCSRYGNSVDKYLIANNNPNCGSKRCDPACGKKGCWGPGREMCIQTKPASGGRCQLTYRFQ